MIVVLDVAAGVVFVVVMLVVFERPRWLVRWWKRRRALRKIDHFIQQAERSNRHG